MSDTQQICPHCGKQIEPGYYAYDQPVDTHWIDQARAQAGQLIQEAIEQIQKEINASLVRKLARVRTEEVKHDVDQ